MVHLAVLGLVADTAAAPTFKATGLTTTLLTVVVGIICALVAVKILWGALHNDHKGVMGRLVILVVGLMVIALVQTHQEDAVGTWALSMIIT